MPSSGILDLSLLDEGLLPSEEYWSTASLLHFWRIVKTWLFVNNLEINKITLSPNNGPLD